MRKRCKIVSGMSLFFWIREKKKKKLFSGFHRKDTQKQITSIFKNPINIPFYHSQWNLGRTLTGS